MTNRDKAKIILKYLDEELDMRWPHVERYERLLLDALIEIDDLNQFSDADIDPESDTLIY